MSVMLTYKNMPSWQAGLFKHLFHKQQFSALYFQFRDHPKTFEFWTALLKKYLLFTF